MTTLEKIQQLNDNEVLNLFQGFSAHLMKQIQIDPIDVIKNPPEEVTAIESIKLISKTDSGKMNSIVNAMEVVPVAKALLEQWASDPEMSPVLDEFLESNPINTMAAGVILAIGSVILMTIVSTSLKIELKDGNLNISYDTGNISNNAVEMVKAVLNKIPESINGIL